MLVGRVSSLALEYYNSNRHLDEAEIAAGADAEADAGAKAVGLRLGLRLRLGLPWEIGLFPPTRG